MNNKKKLQEASLKRVWEHMENHDTGIITATRDARDCGDGDKYTKKENLQRNRSLLAKLQSKRYGVTTMKGSWIINYGTPDAKEVGEKVFFVVDLNDTGKLKKDLIKLGTEWDQDSILFIPESGKRAELIGTGDCPDAYPGKGKVIKLDKRKLGKKGEFLTRVQGRPFVFENIVRAHTLPKGYFARWACELVSKMDWKDL